ncbi:helicase C-terminal domain-containing protein [Breznakiella homolactica]|uniref:ATP-dependent DNA helicase DinG n=1 Tax=Breznakiella homolactica TaxID=2798577 RepID=A0A7T7XL47_9SPIR|nr:helicase C-terminal domain-containing protein [Breznakiella homolactica]QQO08394.1 ATP-dependent DNA helicase DinG [Breznakiella homolactica]
MQASKRFSQTALSKLRSEIADAGGNEVFALGYIGEDGIIDRLEVASRGNEDSVLALRDRMGEADVMIHNHPSGFLTPSDNDLVIASRAAENGIGSFIVDNGVTRVYVIAEPTRRRVLKKLDPGEITAALEPGGAIASRLPVYENRESQLGLMRLIIRGFNEDALVAAEAGTGVGKSFAYLLPALSFALANDERIVISTATINLQQQLFDKDIPLVASALGKKIKTVLVKGRGNYLCRRRLQDALTEPSLDETENTEIRSIAEWAETTKTGSRSDLPFLPLESSWSRVCSEPDMCLGMRCPERERCFFLALRRETADARILVVNHHLLFADLAARHEGAGYDSTVVLPPYTRVIIDEAHTIEGAATSFFSREFSRLGVFRQTGRLYRKRRTKQTGLLLRLAAISANGDKLDDAVDLIQRLRSAADALDTAALELCGGEGVYRLTRDRASAVKNTLVPHLLDVRKHIASLAGMVRDMIESVPSHDDDNPVIWEVKSLVRRLEAIGSTAGNFIAFEEHPDEVLWLERHKGSSGDPWVKFTETPLDVAPSLGDALFSPNKTVVCVSATLTIADSFNYWMRRSGLSLGETRETLTGQYPSPFPYSRSVLLAIPQDAPLPDQGSYRGFVDAAVGQLAEISGGSALVLFTSYDALRSAYAAAAPVLTELGIRCLKQGDDDRGRLLQAFLEDESSVLFATDSFWEGVDAPGNTLRLVILCRLPFRAPSDPVFEARSEAVEERGGSPFMELSLPDAVMKFKQGFGRLMRRSSDHGVVAVLDGRVLHKRYGELFIRSLPETRQSFSDFHSMLRETESFLFP